MKNPIHKLKCSNFLIVISIVFFVLFIEFGYGQDTIQIRNIPPLQNRTGPLAPIAYNRPDLIITNVTGTPSTITGLDSNGGAKYFFATVTVKNIGGRDAWFPSNTWMIGGESQYTNIYAPGQITNNPTNGRKVIRPNQSYTATLAGKVKCLDSNMVKLSFSVDPFNVVNERYETNNHWEKFIPNRAVPNNTQKPDLIIENVWFSPDNPDYYSGAMIHLEMKNIGSGSAVFCPGASIIWMSYIDGQNGGAGGRSTRVIVPREVVGGGVRIASPGELPNGCYRVVTKVDPHNKIEESNENNNAFVNYLSLGGASCFNLAQRDRQKGYAVVRKLEDVNLKYAATEPLIRIR